MVFALYFLFFRCLPHICAHPLPILAASAAVPVSFMYALQIRFIKHLGKISKAEVKMFNQKQFQTAQMKANLQQQIAAPENTFQKYRLGASSLEPKPSALSRKAQEAFADSQPPKKVSAFKQRLMQQQNPEPGMDPVSNGGITSKIMTNLTGGKNFMDHDRDRGVGGR